MSRAYSEIEKLEKRQEILMSAEDLFNKQHGEFPTVNAICLYASMAKGTVYLYFQSKEEIYLALVDQYFKEWVNLEQALTKFQSIDDVIDHIVGFISKNPHKYMLINRRPMLETKCSTEKVLEFQESLYRTFTTFVLKVAEQLELSREEVRDWIMDAYYYLQGLWRVTTPSEEVIQAISGTNMELFLPDYESSARRVFKVLWQGRIKT